MTVWTHDAYVDALAERVEMFVADLRTAELSATVPACPGWDVAHLAAHVSATHRWVTAMIATGKFERVSFRLFAEDVPPEPADRVEYLAEGAAALVQTLREVPPDQPVWVFGVEGIAAFWPRRMLHELTIHDIDLGAATGRAPSITTAVGADGVDEFFALARGNPNLGRDAAPPEGATLVLRAPKADAAWVVSWTPAGIGILGPRGNLTADAVVTADAVDLYTWLWNRGGIVEVSGDKKLVTRWSAAVAI